MSLGDGFSVGVAITNKGSTAVAVQVAVSGNMVTEKGAASPAGAASNVIIKHARVVSVAPGATVQELAHVPLHNYLHHLRDDHVVDLIVSAAVSATGQLWMQPDVKVPITIPALQLALAIPSDQTLVATVSWHNPTKQEFEDCTLFAHLTGTSATVTEGVGDILGNENMSEPVSFHVGASAHGQHTVNAALACKNIVDIHGSVDVDLQ